MTESLVYIQLNEGIQASFEKPLVKGIRQALPTVVTFDFDAYSEESTRNYALDLLRQSRRAALVVEATSENGPFSGLIQFLNRVQQIRHPRLLLLQLSPLPQQLEKMMKVIGGDHYRTLKSSAEAEKLLIGFLDNP